MNQVVSPANRISGLFTVPGDKSLSHRAIMLSALTDAETEISGILLGEDCLATIDCLRLMGIDIKVFEKEEKTIVHGKGLYGFTKPERSLDVRNSGTTIRLLSGILAAQPFETTITGDDSLRTRPMKRIIDPLSKMGAEIISDNNKAPLRIKGNPNLKAINYETEVASAQIKSCILLAGLFAEGETTVSEPNKSRDHTELMLKYLGGKIRNKKNSVTITGKTPLISRKLMICGDISSAAFLVVAALILDNSDITITNIGVNFTRTGIISALREMGADIEILNKRVLCGEYVADIRARTSKLQGTEIGGNIIPRIIDEIPILAVAALFASGKTVIKNAEELKNKESDRITVLASELKKMGAKMLPTDDGMIIEGGSSLRGCTVNSHNDHRIAMSLAIAALKSEGKTEVLNAECINVSFPGFYDILKDTERGCANGSTIRF